MELLNNLWIAISTPNEELINIFLIPASFMEALLIMSLYINIFNITSSIKSKILYVITTSIISLIITYIIPSPFNSFVNYIVVFITTLTFFKIGILKSILAVVISTSIYALIGSLLLNPYLNILNITFEQSEVIPIYRFGYLLIMYSSVYCVSFIIKLKNLKLFLLNNFDKRSKIIIIVSFLLGLFTLFLQAIITVYYIDTLPVIITFLSFISLLAYFTISIYSLTRVTKLIITTQQLESAEEYNKTLRILHDNVRCFKHDFDNIVTTIGGYIKTDDMNGLRKYYERLEDDCQKVNTLYILNPEIINNNGIYNLLTKKYYEAESKGIKINLTFLLNLSSLRMQIYDFAKVLGILLDNAIEESSECNEKIINLTFRNDEKNNRQLLIIENTYNNKDVDISKIFDKGVSGKNNHSGLGLWEIRQILKKNNNLNLYTTKSNKYFTQQFEIY